MRFPELYIERQRLNDQYATGDGHDLQEFIEYQKVLRESSSIIDSIPPNDWGLENGTLIYLTGDTGTLIYLTGDTGQEQQMFRINRNKIEFHDRKDYWFPERMLTAHNLVTLIRSGRAMILQEIKPSFDNWEDDL